MAIRFCALLTAALMLLGSGASAQTPGVAVQVSGGKPIPSVSQLQTILRPGGFVRDVLGWHKADPKCNLLRSPSTGITIPTSMDTLYRNVQAAGGKNFVTLAFNNMKCGQPTLSGAVTFPDTPELRAEFAAYAAGVVRQVPALGGISIWNEMNGTWSGGFHNRAAQLTAYCALSNAVITEVRKVNADIPIAIGATVGWSIDRWFNDMFDVYGCMGKGDATIWLDVHPFLRGRKIPGYRQTDWDGWNSSVGNLRAHGVSNPLFATEWGAKAGYRWSLAHPHGNYMSTFQARVLAQDPGWAGFLWFEMLYDKDIPHAGLFDASGGLTPLGNQYVSEFIE
ncbi:MAG TPA: hypothetical protein VNH44_18140 [Micropepsaceae bacterium]|nr:hypothetical protein [Micropepsaceae bacterium]